MSLQVWLPLNGTLENLGLDDITFTQTTVAGYEVGKIGQALSLLGTNIAFTAPSLEGLTKFSVAFWFKSKTNSSITTSWNNVIAINSSNADESTTSEWRFESSYAKSTLYILSAHNNIGEPIMTGTGSLVSERDKWYHVVATCDGESFIKFYINGEHINSDRPYLGGHLRSLVKIANESADPDALLNDLRIYDHALSQKEIKLLSQGLVAHYPLNDGIGGANLLKSSESDSSLIRNSSTGTGSFEAAVWVGTLFGKTWMNNHLTPGQQYTLSYKVTCLSRPTGTFTGTETRLMPILVHQGGGMSQSTSVIGGTNTTDIPEGESRIFITNFTFATISESNEYYGLCLYTMLFKASSRNQYATFRISNLKLEEGSKATPWIPNSADALYSKMGLDNGIVYDCSGYGHDGTIVGSVSINSETPRYAVSSSFSGSEQILAESPTAEAKSASLWIYISSIGTNNLVFADYKSKLAFGFYSSFIVTAVTGDNNYRTTYESSLLTNNSWHHIVIVKSESSGMELWIDGVKQTPRSGYDAWSSGMSDGLTIGARTNGNNKFIGSISDLRIYATALSAEDIKSLYETRASIDNYNNVYAYELMEV